MSKQEETLNKIRDQLLMDSRIDAKKIVVEVSNGTVHLSGTVDSLAALSAAEIAARTIESVKQVDNRIKIRYPGDTPVITDEKISENVLNAIRMDRNIRSELVKVSVEGGVVTLYGSVDSYWSKVRSEEIISSISGVVQIINNLTVVPTVSMDDNTIAQQIREALQRMAEINLESITIVVEKGVVTLTGKVPHWNAYYSAEFAARNTDGVLDVRNELILA
jgi:osmotically-inducible protein OsmY